MIVGGNRPHHAAAERRGVCCPGEPPWPRALVVERRQHGEDVCGRDGAVPWAHVPAVRR